MQNTAITEMEGAQLALKNRVTVAHKKKHHFLAILTCLPVTVPSEGFCVTLPKSGVFHTVEY